jgi:hypothetical protein
MSLGDVSAFVFADDALRLCGLGEQKFPGFSVLFLGCTQYLQSID